MNPLIYGVWAPTFIASSNANFAQYAQTVAAHPLVNPYLESSQLTVKHRLMSSVQVRDVPMSFSFLQTGNPSLSLHSMHFKAKPDNVKEKGFYEYIDYLRIGDSLVLMIYVDANKNKN